MFYLRNFDIAILNHYHKLNNFLLFFVFCVFVRFSFSLYVWGLFVFWVLVGSVGKVCMYEHRYSQVLNASVPGQESGFSPNCPPISEIHLLIVCALLMRKKKQIYGVILVSYRLKEFKLLKLKIKILQKSRVSDFKILLGYLEFRYQVK